MARVTLRWECAEPGLVTAYRMISKILSDTDFYLAGGTALALQEGHRISIDLDFMSATFADPESLIPRQISDAGHRTRDQKPQLLRRRR
jgi:hypothetical protein